jgi:putative copper resistance protein D
MEVAVCYRRVAVSSPCVPAKRATIRPAMRDQGRALVLTASYGSGHNAAAQAIAVACPLGMGSLGTSRLARLLAEMRPDVIVRTHPTLAGTIAALRARGHGVPATAVVFTDFAAHRQWSIRRSTGSAFPRSRRQELLGLGVSSRRIRVTGIPVGPGFVQLPDRRQARATLGLGPEVPVVLVMAGTYAWMGRLEAATRVVLGCRRRSRPSWWPATTGRSGRGSLAWPGLPAAGNPVPAGRNGPPSRRCSRLLPDESPVPAHEAQVIEVARLILRALGLAGQTIAVGGIVFWLLILRPWLLRDPAVRPDARRALLLSAAGAVVMAAAQLGSMATWMSALAGDGGWSLRDVLSADPVRMSLLRIAGGLVLAALCSLAASRPALPVRLALPLAALTLPVTAAWLSHAAARIEGRGLYLALDTLHQVAAGAWVGGLVHLVVLGIARRRMAWPAPPLRRFSAAAVVSVVGLAASGAVMAGGHAGELAALLGTSWGGMVLTKIVLVSGIVAIGALSFQAVRRSAAGDGTLPSRFWRLAELEVGLGLTVVFISASIASTPVAGDVRAEDRASLAEVAARFAPRWPTLTTPSFAELAAASALTDPDAARTLEDRLWSEYNHNIAGLVVLAMGVLAVLEQRGRRGARHWPLLFLVLSAFLLARSDPGSWPAAGGTFVASLFEPEVVQHRILALLPAAFGVVEWSLRQGWLAPRWRLVFPTLSAAGGALLLGHVHGLSDVKEVYLMEVTHLPLGLLAVLVGWTRWLELRLAPGEGRLPGQLWAPALALIGLLLILYRER